MDKLFSRGESPWAVAEEEPWAVAAGGEEPTGRGRTAHSCVSVYCACTAGGGGRGHLADTRVRGRASVGSCFLVRAPGGDLVGTREGRGPRWVPGAAVAISCVRDDPLRVLCAHQLRTKNYERLVSYLLGRTDARHLGHATQTPVSRDEKHTAGPCRCSSDMRPSNKQK